VAKRPREKQVTAREQHPEWELLDMAAWETKESGLQEASIMRGARETNAQEKESATSRRRSKPLVNVDVGVWTTAQSRAAHRENPSAVLERRRSRTGPEMEVYTEVTLAEAKVHIRLMRAHLAALEKQVSADAPVAAEAPSVPAEAQLVPAEAPRCLLGRQWFLQRHHPGLQRPNWCLQRRHRCLRRSSLRLWRKAWFLQRSSRCLQTEIKGLQRSSWRLQRQAW
jgi:hypothetical protein